MRDGEEVVEEWGDGERFGAKPAVGREGFSRDRWRAGGACG